MFACVISCVQALGQPKPAIEICLHQVHVASRSELCSYQASLFVQTLWASASLTLLLSGASAGASDSEATDDDEVDSLAEQILQDYCTGVPFLGISSMTG